MSAVLTCLDLSKPHTYQHIHGIMLVNLNKIASSNRMSHTDYRLMGILIGLWNKEKGMAFPTIDYLSLHCRMSKSTILRSLNRLLEMNLINIKKQKGKRNKYYLSETLFQLKQHNWNTTRVLLSSTPCDTTHDKEQNRIKTKIEPSKNDDLINTIKILQNWAVINPKKIILKYKLETIINLINITKKHNPKTPGAYFRALLKSYDNKQPSQIKIEYISEELKIIEQMLKCQYWRHKPSGKYLKVKPDIGNHLLLKYNEETNFVHILENANYSDFLHNFETVNNQSQIKIINENKINYSKIDNIKQLIINGNLEEANQLARIFNLRAEFKALKQTLIT